MRFELDLPSLATWAVSVRWAGSPSEVFALNVDEVLRVASVPKVALLATTALAVVEGRLDLGERLDRRGVEPVADSGIWQHLDQDTLTINDVAMLIGTASDNLATNVLLERVSIEQVRSVSETLSLGPLSLLDRVRDSRTPSDPHTLGTASASALSDFMRRIATDTLGPTGVGPRIASWLKNSLDLSMVASAFDLDPLSHANGHSGPILVNKTGTDTGVRADTGYVTQGDRVLVYAAVANWDGAAMSANVVMNGMRQIGAAVKSEFERRTGEHLPRY